MPNTELYSARHSTNIETTSFLAHLSMILIGTWATFARHRAPNAKPRGQRGVSFAGIGTGAQQLSQTSQTKRLRIGSPPGSDEFPPPHRSPSSAPHCGRHTPRSRSQVRARSSARFRDRPATPCWGSSDPDRPRAQILTVGRPMIAPSPMTTPGRMRPPPPIQTRYRRKAEAPAPMKRL